MVNSVFLYHFLYEPHSRMDISFEHISLFMGLKGKVFWYKSWNAIGIVEGLYLIVFSRSTFPTVSFSDEDQSQLYALT